MERIIAETSKNYFSTVFAKLREFKECKIEKTYLHSRSIWVPGGSPAELDRTRRRSFLARARSNLSLPSIPASASGGKTFSPCASSPPGLLSFLDLPPGRDESKLDQDLKSKLCFFYFGSFINRFFQY